jgi:lactate permease
MNCALIAVIIAFATLWVMAGWKKTVEILPVILFTGVVYGAVSYAIARAVGPTLPSVITPLVSLGTLALFLKFWQPKELWSFAGGGSAVSTSSRGSRYTNGEIFRAWSPFLLVTIMMTIWGQPAFKKWLAGTGWFFNIPSWPGLDGIVYRAAPIVSTPAKYAASFKWDVVGYAGTAMLLAIFISLFILRINFKTAGEVFTSTLKQMGYSLLTVASFIGLAFLANYSGISYTLGLAFAKTGALFPVFSPILGWLGVFLTGSVTSSCALFGKLQQVTASQLDLNPILTIAANEVGGIMGKLISPQSIAIACAATGMVGRETDIFRAVLKYSVILLGIVILLILAQAYLVPGIVPVLS